MCDCDPTIRTPKCGVGTCKWPEDVLLGSEQPKLMCSGNTHLWDAVNQAGYHCLCGKAYSPKQPYGEKILVQTAGETREFPEGFKVTFPSAGFWQVTVKPQEDLINSKAAIMVMRL